MAKPMYYWNGTAWEAVAPVVPQSPIAYQASAPSSPSTGDLWIDSDQDLDSYQRQLVRYKFNATGGETSLSGVDANGATLAYTPGAEQVYLNGALLVRGSDYVATNGTSITSLAALSSGDVVEIFAYVAFNPANTYTQSQVDGLVAPMGLVYIHTETFSAASTVSLNNVFNATYVAYKIIGQVTGTTTANFLFRLRASGVDLSASDYAYSQYGAGSSNVSSQTSGVFSALNGTNPSAFEAILQNPFASEPKFFTSHNSNKIGTDNFLGYSWNGGVDNSTAHDGITFFAGSGNITGTIRIYGIKN